MEQEKSLLREDFDPTFLFTWKGIRLEDEGTYTSHEHLELCYVQSGKGHYRIDGQLYEVQEGDLIVLNSGMRHQALRDTACAPVMEIFVGLTDVLLEGQKKNCIPLPQGCPVIHTMGDFKLKWNKLCVSMEAEKEICKPGRYFMMKTYAIQMLVLLIRELEEPQRQQQTGQYAFDSVSRKYVVEKVINYLEDHYEKKISLDQIAGNMYLSPFYISKIFKAETGDTPIHYLIDIRLEKAKEMLMEDFDLSVQEAAIRVGYEDAYHFSKLFKKKFGYPPSAVRSGRKL